jgi:hypothetical protein
MLCGSAGKVPAPLIPGKHSMKTRFALLGLFACLLAATARAGDPADLKEFTSKEGGFTIMMPGTPKEMKVSGQTMFLIDQGTKGYLVSYLDNAALGNAAADVVKKSLENGRDAAVASFKGKLLSTKEVKLGDYPGLEFQIEAPKLGIYRSRIYQVKDRLYQVVVMGPTDAATSKLADRFLDSFKLTK